MESGPEDRRTALDKITDWLVVTSPQQISTYVDTLRQQNFSVTDDELAERIVKNGLVGPVTGLGGPLTLPVAIPTELVFSWKIQAFMACSVAHGTDTRMTQTDLKTDV